MSHLSNYIDSCGPKLKRLILEKNNANANANKRVFGGQWFIEYGSIHIYVVFNHLEESQESFIYYIFFKIKLIIIFIYVINN